jgi:hypothetical protein
MTAADTYLVFDTTDRFHSGAICHGSEEAKDFIAGIKDQRSLRVLRVTLDEMCRDVSDQFLAELEPADEYPETFDRRRYMRAIGAPGW